jgi:chromosome segregation ATPase
MIKIVSLELENVKRVALVHLEPSANGLTVIGGDNAQGKTSILDGIIYALGGEKYRPSNLKREGGMAEARIELTLSNGLKVERKGKNATLKVTDPSGAKAGQKLLDSFIEELALNLPKFLAMSSKDKGGVLLRILGIEDQLAALDKEEKSAYDERTTQGRIADQKKKFAAELPEHHDVPSEPVTAGELLRDQQAVMEKNARNAALRAKIAELTQAERVKKERAYTAEQRVVEAEKLLAEAKTRAAEAWIEARAVADELTAASEIPIPADGSMAELEAKLAEVELINAKVRANLDKEKALADAKVATEEYDRLTQKVEDVRTRRASLLQSAAMPLAGLSVEGGELTYNGQKWDCMSAMERVRAGVAIVRALKPECGFVLLDELEKFDLAQLKELGAWLEANNLQAIATRVSRGDECSVVIEDGRVVGADQDAAPTTTIEDDLEY